MKTKIDKKPIFFLAILFFLTLMSLLHKQYLNSNTTLSFYEYVIMGEDAEIYDNTKPQNGTIINY